MTTDRPPSASDATLLHQFQGGEGEAATALYLRYAGRLRAMAAAQATSDLNRRVDPEDIVQSVFRTFFRRAAAGEYEVPAGVDLWKLFLVIGLNKVRAVAAHHKAAKRDVRQTAGEDALEAAPPANPEDDLRVLQLTIDELLAPLPPVHREIVTLRIAGHEVAEIAAKTGRAKRSVERILQEFKASLGAVLSNDRS
ncbi:MAG TPA: sigma-70 family RNA polymerase sigma factor [Gemmataceae bacterium]|nr:sigma-70 family RNA polymerase sigma factor [Gemmataceae bacterium]